MDELNLTSEQDKKMVEAWNASPDNPPELKELARIIFDKDCEPRSPEIQAIRRALASKNLKRFTKSEIELSEAHKQYITNNAKTMNALEISKIIFANPSLTNIHIETRTVNEFIKTIIGDVYSPETVDDTPVGEYTPPMTFDQALKRVNNYISPQLERPKLTPHQKKGIEVLMGYLRTYRFVRQMNDFDSISDRKLCEDDFIRNTYDKPDLTQEEIAQYVELANQVVQGYKIQRRSERLQQDLEEISGEDAETRKYSMGLVEAIGKASTEYHQCISRQEKLLSNLTQKRSRRIDKQFTDNASVLNLIQLWKSEEGRAELLQHAEKEQAAIDKEVERLSSLPEIKARIFGLNKDGIRYG